MAPYKCENVQVLRRTNISLMNGETSAKASWNQYHAVSERFDNFEANKLAAIAELEDYQRAQNIKVLEQYIDVDNLVRIKIAKSAP